MIFASRCFRLKLPVPRCSLDAHLAFMPWHWRLRHVSSIGTQLLGDFEELSYISLIVLMLQSLEITLLQVILTMAYHSYVVSGCFWYIYSDYSDILSGILFGMSCNLTFLTFCDWHSVTFVGSGGETGMPCLM